MSEVIKSRIIVVAVTIIIIGLLVYGGLCIVR